MPRPEFRKYTPAIRDKALAMAKEIGVAATATKLKISRSKITTWRQQSGDASPRPAARNGTEGARLLPVDSPSANGIRNYHTAEEKTRVLEIANRIGVEAAATETGISANMIYKWRKALKRPTTIAPQWMEGFRAGFREGFTIGKESLR